MRPSASSRARGGVPKPPKPPPGDQSGRGPRGDQPGDPPGYSAPPGDGRHAPPRRSASAGALACTQALGCSLGSSPAPRPRSLSPPPRSSGAELARDRSRSRSRSRSRRSRSRSEMRGRREVRSLTPRKVSRQPPAKHATLLVRVRVRARFRVGVGVGARLRNSGAQRRDVTVQGEAQTCEQSGVCLG